MEAAKPKCSGCGSEGLGKVFIQEVPSSKNVMIASCGDCGVIHSVFAKPFEPARYSHPNPVEFVR